VAIIACAFAEAVNDADADQRSRADHLIKSTFGLALEELDEGGRT
jgi:hypothetical protein